MTTIQFHHVYVASRSAVAGSLEAQGPLQKYFDKTYEDNYCNENSFEKAERAMVYDACDIALRKANQKPSDLDIIFGGDLINQLTSSHYFARDTNVPFIGMYAACATSSLIIGQAAMWIEQGYAKQALAFTSSHVATAERQFRYPNEYGVQKKATTTSTVTGAGAILLSGQPSLIKVSAFTPGKICDWNYSDANDMGVAMAPAAYDTLNRHFQNTNTDFTDYDLIATGDLSQLGFSFLMDLFYQDEHPVEHRLHDCGLMIYDTGKQDVFCGGSGCACSMCVSMAKLLQEIEQGTYQRVMVIATGALLSPVAIQQKESIPCIAHAIVYERSEGK